jgi:hypothetical protein
MMKLDTLLFWSSRVTQGYSRAIDGSHITTSLPSAQWRLLSHLDIRPVSLSNLADLYPEKINENLSQLSQLGLVKGPKNNAFSSAFPRENGVLKGDQVKMGLSIGNDEKVEITENGRELVKRVDERIKEIRRAALGGVSADDYERAVGVLAAIVGNLEAATQATQPQEKK